MKKGYKLSEEHKQNLSRAWNYEKHFTPEVRNKLSLSHKGRILSEETKQKMRKPKLYSHPAWNKGLTQKDERVSKYVNTRKRNGNYNNSEETRKRMSESKKGLSPWNKGLTMENDNRVMELAKRRREFMASERSIDFKKRLSINLKNRRKDMRYLNKNNSIEVKIQNFLRDMNIEFFTHQKIRDIEHSFKCDILIPSMKLVIECDGNYWHSYPIGTEMDHIRNKELIEKGFKVLRLWECEINRMSLEHFKRRLEQEI